MPSDIFWYWILNSLILAKPKGDVKSQGEKTDTDRKRERRQKKKHQKLKSRDREQKEAAVAKLRPGLGNKYSKEKAVKLIEKVAKDSNVKLVSVYSILLLIFIFILSYIWMTNVFFYGPSRLRIPIHSLLSRLQLSSTSCKMK